MTETKTVLGRVFTWNDMFKTWECDLKHEQCEHLLILLPPRDGRRANWIAQLWCEEDAVVVADESGPTEADAILALQAKLHEIAELEAVNG